MGGAGGGGGGVFIRQPPFHPFLQQAYGQTFILHDRMVNGYVFNVNNIYMMVSFLRGGEKSRKFVCLCRT
jgi:hypothetical protein